MRSASQFKVWPPEAEMHSSSPPEAIVFSVQDVDLDELKNRLETVNQRIVKGEKMVQAYREAHDGADNFKYQKLLQELLRERDVLQRELALLAQPPIHIQENRDRKAQQVYAELVDLALKREFDTPKYLEKETWIRQYMQDHEHGFAMLFQFGGELR